MNCSRKTACRNLLYLALLSSAAFSYAEESTTDTDACSPAYNEQAINPSADQQAVDKQRGDKQTHGRETVEQEAEKNNSAIAPKTSIDNIDINIRPIFDLSDPKNDNWVFRTVNALHIHTRPSTIRDDLLFKQDDKVDQQLLDESERRLRARAYLDSADIRATTPCAGHANLKVDVHEVWTLLPEVNYSHTGGDNSYSFGVQDSNFLGYGKTVTLSHASSRERSGNLLEYYDPNLGKNNSILSFVYGDNSDGTQKHLEYRRPFASLETDWTAGFSYDDFTQEDTLYDIGKERDRFRHDNNLKTLFYGHRLPFSTRDSIHRLLIGYTSTQDNFYSAGTPPDDSIFVPENREAKYPWLEYQFIDDSFIKANNIQQVNRVEDINLGAEVRVRLGKTRSPLPKYDGAYVFDAEFSQAFQLDSKQIVLADIISDGYFRDGDFYSGKVKGVASYHWQNFHRGQFFVRLTAARGFDMLQDQPLELGADTGLRGYPIRYQAGDHLQLVNIEQRYFGEREWFSLFYLGAAVFYDEGRAWGQNPIPQSQRGRLRDVGIGIRVSGTRNGNREEGGHNILHIDLAAPLDGDDRLPRRQWLVTVEKEF